ncbi:hypothetical protein GCM10020219_020920 [Nonomuraea dietziae]
MPQTARTGWRTRPSVGSGSNHGSGNRPPSAIALYIVGTVLSASGPDTPAFFRPADTAHACWRSGWCALAPTSTTKATSEERPAASGATQPPSLSPHTPTLAGSTPGWARSALTAPSASSASVE